MTKTTAKQVKDLTRRLSNAGSNLSACATNVERVAAREAVQRNLDAATGLKCRSLSANADLAQAVQWAIDAVVRTDEVIARKAVEAHLS